METILYIRALRIQARERFKWESMGIENMLSRGRDKLNCGGDKSSRDGDGEAEKRKELSDDADLSSIATIFSITVIASDSLEYIKVHWEDIAPSFPPLYVFFIIRRNDGG